MSDPYVHRALEIARAALMEIADLPDEKADRRTAIVNSALTRMHKLTAIPQRNKQAGFRPADPTAIDRYRQMLISSRGLSEAESSKFLLASRSGGCPYVRTGFRKSSFFERMANLIKRVRRIRWKKNNESI